MALSERALVKPPSRLADKILAGLHLQRTQAQCTGLSNPRNMTCHSGGICVACRLMGVSQDSIIPLTSMY